MAYFCTELSDSPSLPRKLTAAAVQSLEHRFLACRLLLRFRQQVARVAAHCLQANHVLAAQPRNRADQHRLAARALADLAGDLGRQPLPGRTPHPLQCFVHRAVGDQVEKGGLLQFYRESLLQRVVEYTVAGLVVEIGEDKRVLVGQAGRSLPRAEVERSRNGSGDKHQGSGNNHLPEFS